MQQIHSRIWHLLRIALALLALEPFAFGQITNVTDDQVHADSRGGPRLHRHGE